MQLSTALSLVNSNNVTEFKSLTDILSPEIIEQGGTDQIKGIWGYKTHR